MKPLTIDPSEGVEQWEVVVDEYSDMERVGVTLGPSWDLDFGFAMEAGIQIEGAGSGMWVRMTFLAVPLNEHVKGPEEYESPERLFVEIDCYRRSGEERPFRSLDEEVRVGNLHEVGADPYGLLREYCESEIEGTDILGMLYERFAPGGVPA